MSSMPESFSSRFRLTARQIAVASLLIASCALLLIDRTASQALQATVVISVSVGLLATGWIPQWLTALPFFALCMIGHVAPAKIAFAGFTSEATWLVLSGLVIGVAIQHTGLASSIANRIAFRLTSSYSVAILGVVAFSLVMAFSYPRA